jgi:tryptophan 2,3-dioxygenase
MVQQSGARTDFSQSMSYGDYLALDDILNVQHPRSPNHNEMLFIIQHQTSELWMKLMLHELRAAINCITADDLVASFKILTRVSTIMSQLVQAWNVLATMTPPEYSAIRPHLDNSSGFQSMQYRCIEFTLGNKNAAMLQAYTHRADLYALVQTALQSPSLYDVSLQLLARSDLHIPAQYMQRDWTQTYEASEAVQMAWLQVYRAPQQHWNLYQLGEKLIDLEDTFRQWRFRHVTTVERIIGGKMGTGGTQGVSYLRKRLNVVLFPELWKLRSEL